MESFQVAGYDARAPYAAEPLKEQPQVKSIFFLSGLNPRRTCGKAVTLRK